MVTAAAAADVGACVQAIGTASPAPADGESVRASARVQLRSLPDAAAVAPQTVLESFGGASSSRMVERVMEGWWCWWWKKKEEEEERSVLVVVAPTVSAVA